MIFPSKWQETFTLSQGRAIGDVDSKGRSVFRRPDNKDITNLARLDLSYGWTSRYQSGVSVKYQNRSREFQGQDSNSSGWSDVGLSHAYKPFEFHRLWFFQTLNIPTATSLYNSSANFSVDARGTGTYQSSLGVFGIHNTTSWDFIYSYELHRSFARTFQSNGTTTEVQGFWGTSATGGVGYIPWKSKSRFGFAVSPRFEGQKDVVIDGTKTTSKNSLVWDSSLNYSYTVNFQHALGLNYTDQTLIGPVKNSVVSRVISFQWQTKWD
jgi:hypothetical protein